MLFILQPIYTTLRTVSRNVLTLLRFDEVERRVLVFALSLVHVECKG